MVIGCGVSLVNVEGWFYAEPVVGKASKADWVDRGGWRIYCGETLGAWLRLCPECARREGFLW